MAPPAPHHRAEWRSLPTPRAQIAIRLDRRLAALAARQHGVVGRGQLVELGASEATIGRWTARGRLIRLYRGVYAVGHSALTPDARRVGAVLAAGPDAVLSHRSAAAAWGLLTDGRSRADITTPRAGGRAIAAVAVHRRELDARDRTRLRAVPITTLERTVLDVAATQRPADLARALERAEELRLLDLRRLRETLGRARGQRGAARLRAAVARLEPRDPRLIRSELEADVLRLIERRGLPRPEVNLWLHEWEVDLHWPEQRVVLELDGWQGHRTRAAFERDHVRDLGLQRRGYRVLRVSWRQFVDDRASVAATLEAVLRPPGDRRRRARA